MIPVVIAVPEALLEPAAELAAALGQSAADRATFAPGLALLAEDAQGQRYRVAAGLVSADWPDRAQSPLLARDWPVDLTAAAEAQALVRVGQTPAPGIIAVDLGSPGAAQVLAAWGLSAAAG